MSWFFGKKKHRESLNTPDEETPQLDDGYVHIGKNQYETEPNAKSSNLYPSISNMVPYPPMPTSFGKGSQENNTNDLSNIPFKYCKELERSINQDLVIDQLRLDEIVTFFKKVKMTDYDYEFSLEQSVIHEMNSQA